MQEKIIEYMKLRGEDIEQALEKLIPLQNGYQQNLYSAARYSLLGGGKRLRPILTLATTESLGGDCEAAMVPACALEMIHTYSLVHDDLPCMDNDDFRRGKPSLHKAFPEGHAVLTGDYLLTYAFEILAKAKGFTAEQRVKLIDILSFRAGGEGMIGGQVMDLEAEGKQVDLDTLRQIHRNKTGALLLASIEFGAVIANVSDKHMAVLQQFGEEIGLAFQIIDDVLDVTASEKKRRVVSSDVANNKSTYVSLMGLEKSQRMAESISRSAIQKLEQLPWNMELLRQIAQLIVLRSI